MGIIGPLPRTAQTGANEWADVETNDARLRDEIDGQLDTSNLKAAAGITQGQLAGAIPDGKLVSPNNSAYKTIFSTPFVAIGAVTANAAPRMLSYAGNFNLSQSIGVVPGNGLMFAPFDYLTADYTVGGLTTNFRLKAQVIVGTTSPSTVTFNTGLYALTSAGDSFTFGALVAGSATGTSPSPALAVNTISRYASADFAASALTTGTTYIPGVIVGSITVPNNIGISFQLQVHHT